jgi:hypothetical protein
VGAAGGPCGYGWVGTPSAGEKVRRIWQKHSKLRFFGTS